MWGRINASLLQVAQGDSSYLMYKSVPLPVDLGGGWEVETEGKGGKRCKLGGGGFSCTNTMGINGGPQRAERGKNTDNQ